MFKVYKDHNNVRVVEIEKDWFRLEYPTDVYFIPKEIVVNFFKFEKEISHFITHNDTIPLLKII